MKCALVLAESVTQIMLTAENEAERAALKLLGKPDDEITVDLKVGTFFDRPPESAGYNVCKSRGDYYRAYESADSLMLVVRPKQASQPTSTEGTYNSASSEVMS